MSGCGTGGSGGIGGSGLAAGSGVLEAAGFSAGGSGILGPIFPGSPGSAGTCLPGTTGSLGTSGTFGDERRATGPVLACAAGRDGLA
jgi:hypothetical protein